MKTSLLLAATYICALFMVYRALSQTLSHLIPTVNGESGGGGGNRAISIGPTLSNRTTGGSETLNDFPNITQLDSARPETQTFPD